MTELQKISIAPHLGFDALAAGEADAPLVLLLHGFAESMHCWDSQIEALADAGYRAVAPSQRGYSASARPDARDASNYHIDRLMDDAMAMAMACGDHDARFHLAGHDWGGIIAWALADRYADRIASLNNPVAAASERVQPRAGNARRRSKAPLAASRGLSRARCR
ncbi:MAG TPA: alpha/beta fold hydrolase [Bradyrhizobium sp.]|nr:alpha/beta fold hydrolase [Bradyrhizobium sp.]